MANSSKVKVDSAPVEEPEEVGEHDIVRFTETPGTRLISAQEWEKAGVPDHPDTIWNAENGWCVPVADLELDEADFDRIIKADRYFRIHRVAK